KLTPYCSNLQLSLTMPMHTSVASNTSNVLTNYAMQPWLSGPSEEVVIRKPAFWPVFCGHAVSIALWKQSIFRNPSNWGFFVKLGCPAGMKKPDNRRRTVNTPGIMNKTEGVTLQRVSFLGNPVTV